VRSDCFPRKMVRALDVQPFASLLSLCYAHVRTTAYSCFYYVLRAQRTQRSAGNKTICLLLRAARRECLSFLVILISAKNLSTPLEKRQKGWADVDRRGGP